MKQILEQEKIADCILIVCIFIILEAHKLWNQMFLLENLCFNKLPIEGKYINQHKSIHYKQCSKHCKVWCVVFYYNAN